MLYQHYTPKFTVKYVVKDLDTHAHIQVWLLRSGIHLAQIGEMQVRREELDGFVECLLHPNNGDNSVQFVNLVHVVGKIKGKQLQTAYN
jgi:hypothetical protein